MRRLFLYKLNLSLNNWPVYTPFNFEKVWYQDLNSNGEWRQGIPKYELFTNFDDDNTLSNIKKDVNHLCSNFPIYKH